MSTLTSTSSVEAPPAPRRLAATGYAILGAAATSVYASYGDPHPSTSQEHGVPFIVGADIVIAALIFGLLVPWAAKRSGRAAGWGLALGIVALITIPIMFWSGFNIVVGAAGLTLGLAARRGARTGLASAATVVPLLALVASTAMVVLGNTVLA